MNKAFDSILQTIVSAADADPLDQFRYTCLCCKELVYVASPEQRVQVVHFRHRHGNNGTTDCENYMPQPGQSTGGSKPPDDGIAFYYDSAKNIFSISLTLSKEDIQQCEQNNVRFEMRTSYGSAPFYSCLIDSLHFSAGHPATFPISQYSESYYCSFTADGKRRNYSLFGKEKPTFFKVVGQVGTDYTAKHILSNRLYTETIYFVIFTAKYAPASFPPNIDVMARTLFQTMGRDFVGILLQFKGKDADTDYYLNQMGYHLESAETLSVIWPPMPQIDETYITDSESVFVLSSFQLRPKGNTNAGRDEILNVGRGVSRISHPGEIRIHYKNAEATVQTSATMRTEIQPLYTEEELSSRYVVPDDQAKYVLHQNDTHWLRRGQEVTLLPGDCVTAYRHTYVLKHIRRPPDFVLDGKDLLDDILRNYKVQTIYNAAQFEASNLSEVAKEYLSDCERTGVINRAVAELIERGVI